MHMFAPLERIILALNQSINAKWLAEKLIINFIVWFLLPDRVFDPQYTSLYVSTLVKYFNNYIGMWSVHLIGRNNVSSATRI